MLVASLTYYKMMQKKRLKPWQMGTHLRVLGGLSNEYQHDRVKIVINNLWVLMLRTEVALALEEFPFKFFYGLIRMW